MASPTNGSREPSDNSVAPTGKSHPPTARSVVTNRHLRANALPSRSRGAPAPISAISHSALLPTSTLIHCMGRGRPNSLARAPEARKIPEAPLRLENPPIEKQHAPQAQDPEAGQRILPRRKPALSERHPGFPTPGASAIGAGAFDGAPLRNRSVPLKQQPSFVEQIRIARIHHREHGLLHATQTPQLVLESQRNRRRSRNLHPLGRRTLRRK